MASKPRVLVLGGVGFIGRNLVKYLVDNDACSKVRVVDKTVPAMAFFTPEFKAAFDSDVVEFKQGNLAPSNQGRFAQYFTDDAGKFDFVINLAGETKYGLDDKVYADLVTEMSVKLCEEAAKHGSSRFIEVSTAQVYSSKKDASKEDSQVKPWTKIAEYKLEAENRLRSMPGIEVIIVRPAVVYGPFDTTGVMPRLVCGATYVHLKEKCKFLWGKDLRVNTVHVRDVAKALLFLAQNGKPGEVYNLADKNETDQQKICAFIEKLFGVATGFRGTVESNLAKTMMNTTVEIVNDKHMEPWSEMCKAEGVGNTPLTPYLYKELLYNNHVSVDGSKIESLGFTYDHPTVTEPLIREMLDVWVSQNLFPKGAIKG